jgi:hypothetical protein
MEMSELQQISMAFSETALTVVGAGCCPPKLADPCELARIQWARARGSLDLHVISHLAIVVQHTQCHYFARERAYPHIIKDLCSQ